MLQHFAFLNACPLYAVIAFVLSAAVTGVVVWWTWGLKKSYVHYVSALALDDADHSNT